MATQMPKKWRDHTDTPHHLVDCVYDKGKQVVISKTWTGAEWEYHAEIRALVDYRRDLWRQHHQGNRACDPKRFA